MASIAAFQAVNPVDSDSTCVGGIVASIAAFQAVDPGSIPGHAFPLARADVEAELLL